MTFTTKTKIHCIVNPASRDFTGGADWPTVELKLRETPGLQVVSVHWTERVGHGAEISQSIRRQYENDGGCADGYTVAVVAVGGDGLAHEVASALRGSPLVLALIPSGTGNDMAATHGILSVHDAIEILKNGVDRMCGAWRVEGYPCLAEGDYPSPKANSWDGDPELSGTVVRWAFNGCDAGITSDIGRSKLTRGKWLRGPLKYTYLGLIIVPFWPRRMVELVVKDESKEQSQTEAERLNITVFAATTGPFLGGGYRFVPNMYPSRTKGRFLVADYLSRLHMVSLIRQLRSGTHENPDQVIYFRDGNHIRLRPIDDVTGKASDVPVGIETFVAVDGEPLLRLPATFSWHVNQIKVRGAQHVDWGG